MSQPAPDNSRPRRPRTERGKRSKNGCRTCLTKRVKCDERRPVCHRCVRLKLCCEWPAARPSLAERRRGFGPIKGRICWSPKSIQPRENDSSRAGEKASTEADISTLKCQTELPYAGPNPRGRPPGHVSSEDHPIQWTIIGQTSSPPIDLDAFDMDSVSPRGRTFEPSPHQTSTSQKATPLPHRNQPLQPPPIALSYTIPPAPTSLPDGILCQKDMQALSFHRTIFAPLKSTQDASRSAHSLFLHRAFDRQMALHFLLAVSHNELQIYKTHQSAPSHESRSHYKRGSELLQRQMGNMHTFPPPTPTPTPTHTNTHTHTPTDHLNIMLSLFYIYLFWLRRDRLNPTKLSQLSRAIYNYLHKHTIDAVCCLGELLPPITNLPCLATAVSDQILLARILIYLYDRDGFCHFFGCGGSLGRYVNAMPEKRRALWQISRIPFVWPVVGGGGGDGAFGMMQGDEGGYDCVLDVYFDLIVLHQEVNCLSQGEGDDVGVLEGGLRESLADIEQNVSFVRLLTENSTEINTLPLMAYVTATVFYALRVYLDRATTRGFGSTPVDPETQRAYHVLLKIAHKTVATGPVQLLERFQWALLVAGMETSDAIHRDWIEDTISDPGMRDLLHIIQQEKARLGGVIHMSTVRRLIRGD